MSTGTSAILTGSPITGTGGISNAPIGTELPTSATGALDPGFVSLGYISEDGLVRSTDVSDDKVRAWGGSVVKVLRKEHSVTYKFTFLESSNAATLKAIYGEDNVEITPPSTDNGGQIKIKHTSRMVPRASWVFNMIDGTAKLREVVPIGQLTMSGDAKFVHSDVIMYDVEVECFEDADGVKAYSYIDDGVRSA